MTAKEKKVVWITIIAVFVGFGAMCSGTSSSGPSSFCKTEATAQYRGARDNDRVVQYLKECKGQTDEAIYGH